MTRWLEVFLVFARLGLTSFGGPVAHLGYFREEFVTKRKWLEEESYADLVALCQFLPGPASSQVGMAIGIYHAGLWGAVAAWLGFTLPSATALVVFALGLTRVEQLAQVAWIHGLKIVAVAVVAQAVWGMAKTLTPDRPRITLALLAAVTVLLWQNSLAQILVIVVAGVVGWRFLPSTGTAPSSLRVTVPKSFAAIALAIFFALLLFIPMLRTLSPNPWVALFDSFYRAGALVFGGGHVVLPLLQAEVVLPGWVSNEAFLAGYGVAQAVPGPLFTFAAYLGAANRLGFSPVTTSMLTLFAIFLPAFLLVVGTLPFWNTLRSRPNIQAALKGINAAVVGILLAALYTPVWTSAIASAHDLALALVCFGLLVYWKIPPWLVVILGAVVAQLFL